MKSHFAISRTIWLTFVGSVLLFVGVWCATRYAPRTDQGEAKELRALSAERTRLEGNDDQARDRLREQQRGIARIAWTQAALAELQARHGSGWHWTWEPGNPASRVTLQRVAPQIDDWLVYRALVTELSEQPGVVVESVDVLADGTARGRRFTKVTIGLRFVVTAAPSHDGRRAAPSRAPPTVAPAESPATPRKVGASTSHRRPSASAEPPAPGTSGAAFRSRPSGV